jgi:drug/metabolite transporter (DMT)-like permease
MMVFNESLPHPASLLEMVKNLLLNKYIILGVLFSGLSSLSWLFVLSKTSLSVSYPFVSLAFPLVLVLSHYFFEDSIPTMRWVGIGIVVIGLIITVQE